MAGDDHDAIASFERAIEICDILISAYKNCPHVNIKIGKMDNALTLLRMAETISPTDDQRSFTLGDILLKQGKLDEFIIHFAKLRSRHTLYIERKIASLFLQNDMRTEATAIYNDILERDPNIDDYNMLGIIFRQQEKYKEAEQCYRKALLDYPDHPTIYSNLAILSLAQDNRFAAKKYVLKALDFDPNHEHAQRLLQKIPKGSL
jgi:tetratricopeptide (TPR) repeat protein